MSVDLDYAWRRLRLEMLLLADGAITAYDSEGGHTKPGSKQPRVAGQELQHFEGRWANAHSRRSKRAILLCRDCADPKAKVGGAVRCCVIGHLRAHLLTKADPSTDRGTREWRYRIAIDVRADTHAGQRAVGRVYGVSEATVRNYRREFGLNGRGPG